MHLDLLKKNARPIVHPVLKTHYESHRFCESTIDTYGKAWKAWMSSSQDKNITGLEKFIHVDYVQGTSQTFDHFIIKNSVHRKIVWFTGDFLYHRCCTKNLGGRGIIDYNELTPTDALIISLPFSGTGLPHPDFESILDRCNDLGIPVCLDLAYWGITKNISIDLNKHQCIAEVTSSLSKPFSFLENHRVGVRFCKQYADDGISMTNEVGMQNKHSMSLGMHFMSAFSCDWNWQTHSKRYYAVCQELNLAPTDTVILALGNSKNHQDFYRGLPDTYRVCISAYLEYT